MIRFYYAPETCSLASHIAMEEAGVDYELHHVDFEISRQLSPEFLALNPKGRVPAMVTPHGVLTETPAMLVYIAQLAVNANLAPLAEPFAFAQLQSFNSYLCSTLHVAHAHRMRGYRWADEAQAIEAMQRKVPDSVGACYEFVEHHGFQPGGPFVMGASYTVADPYLFTIARWMEADGVDPGRFPKVVAHRAMMFERRAVQAALASEERRDSVS